MTWHVLDVGSVWMKEFASALSGLAPTLGWSPVMGWTGAAQSWGRDELLAEPPLRIRSFPLQRGYHRLPISLFTRLGIRQTRRMLSQSGDDSRNSPLICTTPYYAEVAERWKGPVVYYQTDLTIGYEGLNPKQIRTLDKRLCQVATAVCPNSKRVGEYMVQEAGCDPAKIVVVPNATRETNILPRTPVVPGPLPADLSGLPRPILGVLGNLAANLDWGMLLESVERTPEFSWAFIGPTTMAIPDPVQRAARERLMSWGGKVRFAGSKPYGLLQQYARAVDAAVLPYRRKEPTFSGSSTRFYEHLAACRPMLSTRGFEELLHKEPLLYLFDTAAELAERLHRLKQIDFRDEWQEARWQASRRGTWTVRAATVIRALGQRWPESLRVREFPGQLAELLLEEPAFEPDRNARFTLI